MNTMTRVATTVLFAVMVVCSGCFGEGEDSMVGDAVAGEEWDVVSTPAEEEEEEEEEQCVPQCAGFECGDDGCGGSCGGCDSGDTCSDGECQSACTACMNTECSYEQNQCESNTQCMLLLACLMDCSTESCMDSCIYSFIGGADDLIDMLECMDDECSWDCG